MTELSKVSGHRATPGEVEEKAQEVRLLQAKVILL